jgi:hypothetical protein
VVFKRVVFKRPSLAVFEQYQKAQFEYRVVRERSIRDAKVGLEICRFWSSQFDPVIRLFG